jgi:polyhydroxyalkanoate synthesis regulator phasin
VVLRLSQLVIIEGDGLDPAHKVLFGDKRVPFKVNSAGNIEAEVSRGWGARIKCRQPAAKGAVITMTSADKVKGLVDQATEKAEPLVDKVLEKAELLAEEANEKAESLVEKVKEKAEPLLEKIKEKAEPLVEKGSDSSGKENAS